MQGRFWEGQTFDLSQVWAPLGSGKGQPTCQHGQRSVWTGHSLAGGFPWQEGTRTGKGGRSREENPRKTRPAGHGPRQGWGAHSPSALSQAWARCPSSACGPPSWRQGEAAPKVSVCPGEGVSVPWRGCVSGEDRGRLRAAGQARRWWRGVRAGVLVDWPWVRDVGTRLAVVGGEKQGIEAVRVPGLGCPALEQGRSMWLG